MKTFALGAAALLLALPAIASAQDGFTPLDTSRLLREATRAAADNGDFEAARRTNAAALALQPGHPGLLSNAVILSGMAGDPARQIEALAALAGAGLTFDLSALDTLEALRERAPAEMAAIEARLDANAAPKGRAEPFASIDLPEALIEALEIDVETERLYLGGVAERAIWVVEPGRQEPRLFADASDGLASVLDLAVDGRNRLLYATTATLAQTPLGEDEEPSSALLAFDLVTGDLMARHEIEGTGRLSGLTVSDGVVHASESGTPRVYRLDDPRGELTVLAEDRRFSSLQDVVVTAGSVWVADYALGLWRIDPTTGEAHLARTPASGESLLGLDALALGPDGAIHAVRNGVAPMGVLRITLDAEGRVADAEPVLTVHPAFGARGEPTCLQIARGRAFLVANAQWALFPEDGSPPPAVREPTVVLSWPVE